MTEAPEGTLIRRILRRDEAAFRVLYRRHAAQVYRLALRMTGGLEADAEDIAQEAWRRALRGLRGFAGRSGLRTWLLGITANCALEHHRRRRPTEPLFPESVSGECPEPSRALDLEAGLRAMPTGYRAVLILHDVEGFTHEDIGGLLGIAPGTSKSQLSRARGWLRHALGARYMQE